MVDRPSRVSETDPWTAKPGRHRLGEGPHHYVVWGVSALGLDVTPRPGVRAIEWLEAPPKDASGKATHDGGVAHDKALSLARARRLEQASADAAMNGAREPMSILADKPLAMTSIEVEVEEIAIPLSLSPRDDFATRKLEALVRAALVVLASTPSPKERVDAARPSDPVTYVARAFASSAADREAARAILDAFGVHQASRALFEGATSIRTDVFVALTTFDGSLGEGRVPVVITTKDATWAVSIALAGELSTSKTRELGLAATAIARDLGTAVRARLFVIG